ncbi:MAG: CoA transferase [Burkholderiaceae bacterium]|nr:CoA transferase [Burkholderiaceae bacterium]
MRNTSKASSEPPAAEHSDTAPAPVTVTGPLSGIRVIDLTVALAGPYCTLMLGGMGAEVVKIDAPGGSDIGRFNPPFVGPEGLNYGQPRPGELSLYVMDRHRNKKSITLDLKCEEGRAIFIELVKQADVLVENFSVGTTERLGIDFETLHAIHPTLVYASMTSIGSDAPPSVKGMDIVVQALSGIMEVNGFADGPPTRIGFPIADMLAPHNAVSGILAALLHRAKTGRGQKVEVNLLDSLVCLLAMEHYDVMKKEGEVLRSGNHHDRLTPFGLYRAKDGYVAIGAPSDDWTHALFEVMGMPELVHDARYRTRGARALNGKTLTTLIEQWSGTQRADDIVAALAERGVTSARVRTPNEAFADPAILAREAVSMLQHPKLPDTLKTATSGIPIRFSECKVGYDGPAPDLGADNHEVYTQWLHMDEAELQRLRERAVIS